MYPTKRRRLGDSTSTLTKPFRSPLSSANVPSKQPVASLEQADQHSDQQRHPSPTQSEDTQEEHSPVCLRTHEIASRSSPLLPRPRHMNNASRPQPLSSPTRPSRDPAYLALQKQHSSLMLQFKDLSSSVDTSAQALKVLNSNADADLERVIQKWRIAARDVAEELFSVAKERVDKMGGVSAWRERCRPLNDENEPPWGNGGAFDEDELTDEQREQLEVAREDARREAERYGLLEQRQQNAVDLEDDSFTIDMMLKQLNVDLDVIGYDVHSQRWSD